MSTAILELNDAHLCLRTPAGTILRSSGYACFGDNLLFGEDAKKQLWRQPARSDSKFWLQLGTQELSAHQIPVRHRADIAYEQLKQLWTHAGATELLLLVPASFSDSQLGLLVGMCEALPDCRVTAVVSDALLYASSITDQDALADCIIVNMGLHHIECARIQTDNEYGVETQHELFSEMGQHSLETLVARHLANRFIELHRYDPQHTAEGDQELHNHVPEWLNALREQGSINIQLHANQGEYQLGLTAAEISSIITNKLSTFIHYVDDKKNPIYVDHQLSSWLELTKSDFAYRTLQQNSAINSAYEQKARLVDACQPLHRLGRIALKQKPRVTHDTDSVATHILINSAAYPIHQLSLNILPEGGVTPADSSGDAALLLRQVGDSVYIDSNTEPSDTSSTPCKAVAGASLELANVAYPLVRLATS